MPESRIYVPEVNIPETMFYVTSLDGSLSIRLANPDQDSGIFQTVTMVNSGRNANAVITAQKIGRDQDKNELKWAFYNKNQWETLLRFFYENFFFGLNYYSPVFSRKITRKCYISDRFSQPLNVDANGIPIAYVNCSLKFVDTGEGD